MRRLNIKFQILIIAMIPVFLIDAFLTYVHVNNSINQAELILKSKGEIIAEQIAGASEFNFFSGNYEQIQYLLDQSINTNDIIFAAVYNLQGETIAKAEGIGYTPDQSHLYFYYRQAIKTQNLGSSDVFEPDTSASQEQSRNLGWVHLYISKKTLEQNKITIYKKGLVFFLAMLVLAILLTSFISQKITRPIYKLLDHLKEIEKGNLGQVIKQVENNEIGDVQKGFNSMSQSLLANRMQLDQKIKTATLELMNAITDLEYKNKELAVARDEAQNADRVKSQFLANMSHEIRTPINGIKGFVNLLSKSGLKPDQKRYTDIISQSTEDLTSIVNEVLDFSKIESGKVEIINEEFNLHELIESTRDSLYTVALEKGIDLHLIIYSDTPRQLSGDQFRLKQILINLIGNAIKFTDSGYVSITVLLEDESDDQTMIKFQIEDSGIGIDEQDQKSLFQAFTQIETESNRRYTGTGLGLVISRNLAKLMGGDILLKSEPNAGSVFTLILPFKPSKRSDVQVNPFDAQNALIYAADSRCLNEIRSLFNRVGFNTETGLIDSHDTIELLKIQLEQNLSYLDLIVFDLRHNTVHPDTLFSKEMRNKKRIVIMHYDLSLIDQSLFVDYEFISVINTCSNLINRIAHPQIVNDKHEISAEIETVNSRQKKVLLVDDNKINLTLESELIRIWGHQPFEAKGAMEAMHLFQQEKFDLILLDIQMPEIDGVELMQMMREKNPHMDTPIAAITANIMEQEKNRLLALGFDAYISKPIDEEKLRCLIDHGDVTALETNTIAVTEVAVDAESSIDFDLTLKLSAQNKALVVEMFDLLQKEIPDYKAQINGILDAKDFAHLGQIVHKLQGITCYTGLPRLKTLMDEYKSLVRKGDENELPTFCSALIKELDSINQQIPELTTSPAVAG